MTLYLRGALATVHFAVILSSLYEPAFSPNPWDSQKLEESNTREAAPTQVSELVRQTAIMAIHYKRN
jgi:hypothetical protein